MSSKVVPLKEYTDIYIENLTDPSFTGTVLTCDIEHKLHSFYKEISMPRRFVPTPISKSYYGIGFLYPNLWAERFNEIVEGLVSGGIMNFYLERMTKSKWNLMDANDDPEKVVLNMTHLGFGFQICFFSIYFALLTFVLEIIVHWIVSFKNVNQKVGDKIVQNYIAVSKSNNSGQNVNTGIVKQKSNSDDTQNGFKSLDFLFGEKIEHVDDNLIIVEEV